ncbi:4-(cytidine 5'-diphospho)-2-C-methyl-D-erythritol kinase [Candidatus Pelagibacter bacterium nBUS_33]|uniref:4-(cytidine 5'-diphospho)-2-C-methyl-D-erythritol kinase n=1 Tax=Candidatus Pelagibacter bacterium nBUS_33 TaxID=3374193 RepID=UPI003EB9904E
MNINNVKSFGKINLALHVTGKLTKLHKIESIVKFIKLHDLITIKKINSKKHKVSFNGIFSKNINKNNTVNKLFTILDGQKLLNNKKFQIKIKKNIPQEAGLGGGSMNAANILGFLIKKKFIKLSQKKIFEITNAIGSDVILGINPINTILSSKNIIKKFSKSPNFYTLLVRPNFGCSTKKIYSGVKKYTKPIFNNPKQNMFSPKFLLKQENALEKVAFLKYPKLRIIKSFLENLNKPLFVRMTGSGSVLVAYYQKKQDCELAKVRFKRKYRNYWCITSKTI